MRCTWPAPNAHWGRHPEAAGVTALSFAGGSRLRGNAWHHPLLVIQWNGFQGLDFFKIFIKKKLNRSNFIWLPWVLVVTCRVFDPSVVACRIFSCGMGALSCYTWDLVP